MAKADKVENKDQKVEKSSKKTLKSSYSKKKSCALSMAVNVRTIRGD